MNLDTINPVALVTYAASGVGATCARELARHATGGLLLVDFDEAALLAAADALEKPPEKVSTLAFDVSDSARWSHARDFISAEYGRLDWAIIDAGAAFPRRANYLDTAHLSLKTLIPLIGANNQGGAIILAASAMALKGELNAGAKSPAGLAQLLRAAANEGAAGQVRVNAIAFGGADDSAWRRAPSFQDLARESGSERGAFAKLGKLPLPLARFPGADLDHLIAMLLSDAASMSGATLVVDGAFTL
jgi:NAD(P)-dependent dehydrogenase (short-subunit alcohol dehydrogenase family)